MRERGEALVRQALGSSFLAELQREARGAPLKAWPTEIGGVRQRMEGHFLRAPFDGFPVIRRLADALEDAALASEVPGLRTWRPNEVSIQRYRPGPPAIESHRDNVRYRRLIAIFTTAGRAAFRVLDGRHGEVVAEWIPKPGDLVLLRAPGLAHVRDGRPFHALDAPQHGERWSVSFRMDTRSGERQRLSSQVTGQLRPSRGGLPDERARSAPGT